MPGDILIVAFVIPVCAANENPDIVQSPFLSGPLGLYPPFLGAVPVSSLNLLSLPLSLAALSLSLPKEEFAQRSIKLLSEAGTKEGRNKGMERQREREREGTTL